MINFVRAWKFELGFLLIIATSLGVWYLTIQFGPEAREERKAREYLEQLQAEYEEDTYGGATPEETLALFIDALEKGDIELASKYFLPEDREEIKIYFSQMKKLGDWDKVLQDAHALTLTTKRENEAFYTIADKNGRVTVQIVMNKNNNDIWKISDI